MKHRIIIISLAALLSSLVMAQTPEAPASSPETISLPKGGEVRRLGNAPKAEASEQKGVWRAGSAAITTPLPNGYPRPTAPGEVVLKTYSSVRRAEVSGKSMPALGSNVGFWKLFQHIQKREIAMTSPVEMEYPGLGLDGAMDSSAWLMAFLYRTSELGELGQDGDVMVRDTMPVSVLSLGVIGGYGLDPAKENLPRLAAELAKHPTLEASGSPRILHYNGPDTPSDRRWSEVQLPVRLKAAPPAASTPDIKTGVRAMNSRSP